ncbi:MAG: response regulator [Patescibacteria group bacterium]
MIIDDQEVNILLVSRLLQRYKKVEENQIYKCSKMAEYKKCLKDIKEKKHRDITFFVDRFMPDMKFNLIFRDIRALANSGVNVKIIAMSADERRSVRNEMIEAGANFFVPKSKLCLYIKG